MRKVFYLFVAVVLIQSCLNGQPQTTAADKSDATNQWWEQAKSLGGQVAALKRIRSNAYADLNKRLREKAQTELPSGTVLQLAERYQELRSKAEPDFSAIQQKYDPQIVAGLESYGSFLKAAAPSNTPINAASAKLRPTILYQEKAKYTEAARQNKVQGVVLLSLVFNADGTIEVGRVIHSLPDGLTDEAINAAQEIIFVPPQIEGKPVSVRLSVEYTFSLI